MNLQLSPQNQPLVLATAPQAVPTSPFSPLGTGLGEEKKLELLEYWRSITKRKWAILGLGLAVAMVAAAITFALTPVYRSTAALLIEPGKAKLLSIEDVYSGASRDREHYQTQVEILKSREVALKTVRALKLWQYPEYDPRVNRDGLRSRFKNALGMADPKVEWTEQRLAEAAVGRFAQHVSVEPVRLSSLVRISVEAEDRQLAALAANTLATVYIDNDREARLVMGQSATGWLQDRLASLRDKLSKSEQALQNYREQRGLVNLSGSAQTVAGQQVNETTQRLAEARSKRAELESAYRQVKQVTNGDYSGIPAVVRNTDVATAKRLEDAAASKLADLQQRYGDQHFSIIEAKVQLKSAQDNLRQQMRAVTESLSREYEAARDTERSLDANLQAARGSVQNVNRQEFQLAVLEREVQTNKQLYEMFMTRAKETSIGSDLQSSVARVVDPATVNGSPIKPAKAQIVTVSMLLALLAGALASLLLDKLDNTVKGADDAESRLHQPLLTALPELKAQDMAHSMRLFIDQPQSHYAESIRTARTGVLLSNLDAATKILLITSSLPGEGKTTLATNLALAHSQTKRTLLIDADMRRPQVGKRLGLPGSSKGLSDFVAGTAGMDDCVHLVSGTSLHVMPVGHVPPNPLELLLSQRFRESLEALSQRFEIILIDSPPVELVSDALVIGPYANGVIYVVKAMNTPHPLARKGITRLQRGGAKMLGVVLNSLDFVRARKYHGDYSGQGKYGYGDYGYQTEASAVTTPSSAPPALHS